MKIQINKTFLIFFCLFFLFSPLGTRKAEAAWIPAIDPMIKQALEVVYRTFDKIMGGTTKQTTALALYSNMTNFIGGSSSGGSLITRDWTKALVEDPEKKTVDIMKDYISETIGGRGGSKYEGFGGNYMGELGQAAKKMVSNKETPRASFEGDPGNMFAEKDGFQKFEEWFSGINHPVAYMNHIEDKKREEEAEQKRLAEVPRIAYQGFEPKGGYDNVSIPGSLLKDNLANIQDIGNKVMAGSDGMMETMITAILNQIINQMMMQGL